MIIDGIFHKLFIVREVTINNPRRDANNGLDLSVITDALDRLAKAPLAHTLITLLIAIS